MQLRKRQISWTNELDLRQKDAEFPDARNITYKYNLVVYSVMLIFSSAHCKFCGIFDMHDEYDDWLDAKLFKIVDWLDFAFTLKF